MDFLDKVAVITGGASGIGFAIAQQMSERGARVALLDRRQEQLANAVASLRAAGGAAIGIAADVTDMASVESAAAAVQSELGSPDILVNNAGVFLRGPKVEEIRDDVWNWILSVNLFGAIHCTRAFLPLIRSKETGYVVNIASISGFHVGIRNTGAYNTSKYALVALSEALAHSLAGTNVGVSIVAPSAVSSDFYVSSAQSRGDLIGKTEFDTTPSDIAAGMSPDEVARRTIFGMERKQLYVFTHPEARQLVTDRYNRLMAAFDSADEYEQCPA